jgi:hypothetical protein
MPQAGRFGGAKALAGLVVDGLVGGARFSVYG